MKYQENLGSKNQTTTSPTFEFPIPNDSIPNGSEILSAMVKVEGYAGLNRPKSNYKMQIVHGGTVVYTSGTVALNRKYQQHTFKNLEQYFISDGKSLSIRISVNGTYRYFEFRNVTVTVNYNPPKAVSSAFAGTSPWKAVFMSTTKAKAVYIGTKRIL